MDGEQGKIGENRSPAVSHLLADLGWVDFYLGSSSLQIEINLTKNQIHKHMRQPLHPKGCGGCDQGGELTFLCGTKFVFLIQ